MSIHERPLRARHARAALVAAALVAAGATRVSAQGFTLGDLLARARSGAASVNLPAERPVSAAHLVVLDAYFSALHVTDVSLDALGQLYAPGPKDLSLVARWNRHAVAPAAIPGFADSLTALDRIINAEIGPLLQTRISEDSLKTLFAPVDAFGTIVLQRARAANQEKLRRFAQKYGPGSPQLNVVEVALNYLAQLKAPGFAPLADGYTSPYEIVATYRTTDLTASTSAAANPSPATNAPAGSSDSRFRGRAVTSGQLGLRKYNFDPACSSGSRFSELVNPCQASAGVFLMGPTDSPLLNPLRLTTRGGLYVSRGKYHFAGVVFGPGKRFVFGLDQQIIPYIF